MHILCIYISIHTLIGNKESYCAEAPRYQNHHKGDKINRGGGKNCCNKKKELMEMFSHFPAEDPVTRDQDHQQAY